jgi:FMN-dependent NADH-azoreductase
MPRLLQIHASPRGKASHSRKAAESLVTGLQRVGAFETVTRDLASSPLPHPDRKFVEASLRTEDERDAGQRDALALSEALIVELEAADLIVIDTPMHNFTLPSTLKAWIDHVVRPNRTFRGSRSGKIGLLADRKIFLIIACGGPFSNGGSAQTDFLTPYLRYVLSIIGLRDLSTLRLENLNRGPSAVEQAQAQAASWIAEQVDAWTDGEAHAAAPGSAERGAR